MGSIVWQGYNDAFRQSAGIRGEVESGVGATGADMPGRLIFLTSPDGSASITERMRIDSSGNVGIGTNAPGTTLEVNGGFTITPSGDISLLATDTIVATSSMTRVVGNGGAVVVTSTPSIADGTDGQIIILQGTSETNTVKLQDQDNQANTGLQLNGNEDFTMGKGDMITLIYDSGDDVWLEQQRSDN